MKLRLCLLSSLLILFAVSANAQKVAVGYDRAADFSKFKTYSWTAGVPAKNPQIHQQIVAAIEEKLNASGWTRVNDGGDVLVSYHAAVVNTFDSATVARPGTWGPSAGSVEQAWLVVKGSLIVEIKNPGTNQELWRAAATDTLSNEPKDVSKDVEKASKKVKKVVDKMFKGFPPSRTH
jgi:hypothetical protein